LLTCFLFFAASILSTQTIIAQDSDNDGMIDALENTSADGDLDTSPNRLDRDSDDDAIGDIFEYGVDVGAVNFALYGDSDGISDEMDATLGETDLNTNGVIDSFEQVDTDGDGVLYNQEIADGTNPNDPYEFLMASITESQIGAWLTADCDGDGIINETEIIDGTRVTGQGFGESKLANDCTTLKKCTDLQHEENRYSEFIVMEYQNNLNQVIHWE
jgi:hypothetical protein